MNDTHEDVNMITGDVQYDDDATSDSDESMQEQQPEHDTYHHENGTSSDNVVSSIIPGTRIIRSVTILDKPELTSHLTDIENHGDLVESGYSRFQNIEASNKVISEIDVDIVAVHKRLRDLYAARFPELEQLLPNSLDYAKVVKAIGANTSLADIPLDEILPSHAVMVVQMTFTTTTGKKLSDEVLEEVMETADFILELHQVRNKIFEHIEKQMAILAPNTAALVGSGIAAKLIGLVGGLEALSRMPGCNVMIIGSVENKISTGLTSFGSKHRGVVFHCDLVQNAPSDLQRKILKVVSSKIVLAARVDMSKDSYYGATEDTSSNLTGELGRKFREEIERKIMKMQEPPPKKQKKALPIPLEKPKKKRGGAKYRRMKERLQTTDLQRQKNRMGFNQAEDDDYGTELSMGLLGSADSGKVRIAAQDTQRLSKAAERKLKKQQQKYASNRISAFGSGSTTSLAFSANQGLELGVPSAPVGDASSSAASCSVSSSTQLKNSNGKRYFRD